MLPLSASSTTSTTRSICCIPIWDTSSNSFIFLSACGTQLASCSDDDDNDNDDNDNDDDDGGGGGRIEWV